MAVRLYQKDSYLMEFDALVSSCRENPETPGTWLVTLDKTAFYPESGGQHGDRGRIGDGDVVDVFSDDDDEVIHVVKTPMTPGDSVACVIDRERRLSNMQKHTAQHILSRCFFELCNGDTVSARLGNSESTIDVDIPSISSERLADVERMANRVVREDRRIKVRFMTRGKASQLPVRRLPDRKGKMRLVVIDGFDWTACGGTHLARTGEVGYILVTRTEKYKGMTRVTFVAGDMAVERGIEWRNSMLRTVKALGCGMDDVPENYLKNRKTLKDCRIENERLISMLSIFSLKEMRDELDSAGLSVKVVEWGDMNVLRRSLIEALDGRERGRGAMVRKGGGGEFVVGVADTGAPDLLVLLDSLCSEFSCRGGGSSRMVQGSGVPREEVARFVETVRNFLNYS